MRSNGRDILIQQTHLHENAPFSVPREHFFFRVQIGYQFHFLPLSAFHSSALKLHLESQGASFERHFSPYKSPGKALLRTSGHFGPQPPPGIVGVRWTPELYSERHIILFQLGRPTGQSPGKALLRTSGHFWPFFGISGSSEQGLPLDRWDPQTPLTLFTLGFYMKIGGSRDPIVPREIPAQNNEGQVVLSSVPPGTATTWRPPYLHWTDQSKQSSGGNDLGNSPGKARLRTTKVSLF